MNCSEVRAKLAAGLEGGLDPKAAMRIKEHLGACEECARELEALRRTGDLLATIRLEEPPESVRKAVLVGLEAPPRRRLFAMPGVPRWAAAAAAVLAIVGVAVGLRPGAPPATPSSESPEALLIGHVAAGWNDPFADRSALALDLRAQSQGEQTP
jgi:predicted anti-sigma-YlaC factor YlaD